MFASTVGCAKKEDTSQTEPDPSAETDAPTSVTDKQRAESKEVASKETETPVYLSDVLSSWDAEDKERATKQFIKVDWGDPRVFANVPVLNPSEQDFMTLSQDQQIQFVQDAKEFATKLRKLGLHLILTGDTALASGDKGTSKKHFDAVQQCAQSIASNDCYELIQLTAKGLVKAVEDKLSTIE